MHAVATGRLALKMSSPRPECTWYQLKSHPGLRLITRRLSAWHVYLRVSGLLVITRGRRRGAASTPAAAAAALRANAALVGSRLRHYGYPNQLSSYSSSLGSRPQEHQRITTNLYPEVKYIYKRLKSWPSGQVLPTISVSEPPPPHTARPRSGRPSEIRLRDSCCCRRRRRGRGPGLQKLQLGPPVPDGLEILHPLPTTAFCCKNSDTCVGELWITHASSLAYQWAMDMSMFGEFRAFAFASRTGCHVVVLPTCVW